jgi:glycosyltransferase involved in cell wall biosynthesis
MAAGTPVAASDLPVHREIAGAAALFFRANDPADLAAQIHRIEQPSRRAELIRLGEKQAKKFSWPAAAGELQKIIETLKLHDR